MGAREIRAEAGFSQNSQFAYNFDKLSFFPEKIFWISKKDLKSLEANSFISPQNYVIRPG